MPGSLIAESGTPIRANFGGRIVPSRFDAVSRFFATRRLSRRAAISATGGIAAFGLAQAAGTAQDPTSAPSNDAAPTVGDGTDVQFLFVQTFGAGSLRSSDDGDGLMTLTADHLAGQTIYFSDRPERIVGMLPTETFLGAGRRGDGPEGGPGFTEANPPNAALVFAPTPGDDSPGEVLVVELIDPTYDPETKTATYDTRVLDDVTSVDMTLVQAPVAAGGVAREFGTASLFIDSCPDGTPICYNAADTVVGDFGSIGFRYDWGSACCRPCGNSDPQYWIDRCNETFAACERNRNAWADEKWTCYPNSNNQP